jgi:hypothetical protein
MSFTPNTSAPKVHWLAAAISIAGLTILGGLEGREARAEAMTCVGTCRVEYGACLMAAKELDPVAAGAHRTECGHTYLRCAMKCKQGSH